MRMIFSGEIEKVSRQKMKHVQYKEKQMMECYIKDYPRPQFVRSRWDNLNGTWDFCFDDKEEGELQKWYIDFPKQTEIAVPFTCETEASGIGDEKVHPVVWYHKTVKVDENCYNQKVMLNIEGSDYETKVWVNGIYIGCHQGGYSRISMNITNALFAQTADIVICVSDSLDRAQMRGKQRYYPENFQCWYIQTTGIHKTVWLEYLPESYIRTIKMTPDLERKELNIEWDIFQNTGMNNLELEIDITYKGIKVNHIVTWITDREGGIGLNVFEPHISSSGLMVWAPDNPSLYDICFRLLHQGRVIDEVKSYFGMRKISIDGQYILLNGEPLYQKLLLDQGYWKKSHLTPPDEDALIKDIDIALAMGFNGVRKHQKVEDERFLYWCDVKGLLVWAEAPSTYVFNDRMTAHFMEDWVKLVHQQYNHPCIITWTPLNESWGIPSIKTDIKQQAFTQAVYYATKAVDTMRPVIVNDGWEHTISDIITIHDYQESGKEFYEKYTQRKDRILGNEEAHNGFRYTFARGFTYKGQPVIISEYGGIAFHSDQNDEWGYGRMVNSQEMFLKRFDEITSAIKQIPYITGYCYTQLSDVQQEINGLLTEDRQPKLDSNRIKEINEKKFSY